MSLTTSAHWAYNPGGDFYGTTIDGSLRFNDDDNAYLSRTPSTGNRKTWTFSCWVKRSNIKQAHILTAYTNSADTTNIAFGTTDDRLQWYDYISGYRIQLTTTQKFRDVGGWYHLVFQLDTTQATASDRAKIYVNGEQITAFDEEIYPSQNADLKMNTNIEHRIGDTAQFTRELDGYLADVHFIDGTALDPTSFGETKSGIWIPKAYSGSYGTNGYHLEFAGNANDTSGNGNNWTANNLSSYDYVPDSPTNNFNQGMAIDTEGPGTLVEGGLRSYVTSQGNYYSVGTSMAVKGGKWYYESRRIRGGNNSSGLPEDKLLPEGRYCNSGSNPTGSISINVGTQDGSDGVYMTALDLDNGYVYRGRNGSWSNGASAAGISSGSGTGAVKTLTSTEIDQYLRLCVVHRHDTGTSNCLWNFGQDSTLENYTTAGGNSDENGYGDFKYAPPTNFLAMCSQNVPAPAIDPAAGKAPDDYFNSVTYTGVGGQSITGVGFQPDWVWIKSRNVARDHKITDAVRGVNKELGSQTTAAEVTRTTGLTSFDSDGFTVGSESGYDNSGDTFVAWNWLAGNSTSSNTDGSITSTVSANQDAGFSVITYTGVGSSMTFGHGLGATPQVHIIKKRNGADQWNVYHEELGLSKLLRLNTADAAANDTAYLSVSDTTIGIGVSGSRNGSGDTYVCYAFAEKEGYSKIGSYTGNGSADGAFIYTGFRPAWIMIKRSDSTGSWHIIDTKRIGYNERNDVLLSNSNSAEQTNYSVQERDILSNGFKMRDGNSGTNASGGTYIYMAFAEQPFKYANAR
jgi:hypothetical protein